MSPQPRILVTGFKPFLGETVNPSEILLESIKRDFAASVETLVLPVSFAQCFSLLTRQIQSHEYDYIFMLGQAGGRNKVCLERVALNWIETTKPDEDGYTPPQQKIDAQEEGALFSSLPLSEMAAALKEQGLPIKVSLSAGGYVCNYLYFRVLQSLKARKAPTEAVFIHVPYLTEQLPGKAVGTPGMDIEEMKATLYPLLTVFSEPAGKDQRLKY